MADQYDLLVIGAGPGGYVAAIRGAQLGMKVGIIEREHMAGICSNWGCVPTKALLRSAEIYGHMGHARDYGLTAEKYGFEGLMWGMLYVLGIPLVAQAVGAFGVRLAAMLPRRAAS